MIEEWSLFYHKGITNILLKIKNKIKKIFNKIHNNRANVQLLNLLIKINKTSLMWLIIN